MPNLKPLKRLVTKARDLRDSHNERHRPSGFGFALSDSIDYFDASRWDELTAQSSVFLSRRYLQVLEANGPDNLRQRYAMIFRGHKAVAAVAAQRVTISLARLNKSMKHQTVTKPLEQLEESMLVCGNLLSWGQHGVVFAPDESRAELWPAIAEALYRIRRADRLLGSTDFVMVKDITDDYVGEVAALSRFSYRELETEPNMVLQISDKWKTYEDYLASLTSRYRKASKQIEKEFTAAGCRVEALTDLSPYSEPLHKLYLQTHKNARLRLVTLSDKFIPALAETFGTDFRCTVAKRDDEIVGFVTTIRDGQTAVGYYIGFDRELNSQCPIYFRLLQVVVDDAIKLGCSRLSLGRTALEPKARLGARPEPMRVWLRHRVPMLNVLVRGLLRTISDHEEPPDRNPFK